MATPLSSRLSLVLAALVWPMVARAEGGAGPSPGTGDPDPEAGGGDSAASPDEVEPAVEVSVLGTPAARAPGSVRFISNRELEREELDDPHAVLRTVPGVHARGEDGVGLRPNISLRGVNPDRSKKVALLEDGIPLGPAPYSAPAAYYFPLMTRMTGVHVIKGPAAIGHGPQTIAGAIDLRTRPVPSEPMGALDLGAGEYGYGKVHGTLGSSNEAMGFLIEGVHLRADGFKSLPNGADTGFARNEWMAKASWDPDPTSPWPSQFGLKLTYSDELSNETYLGLSDEDFREDPLRRYAASQLDQMRNHRTALVLSHRIQPREHFSIETDAYRHDFSRIWRKVNGFRGADLFDVLTDPASTRNSVYYGILADELAGSGPTEALRIGPNQRDYVSQGVQTRLVLTGNTGLLAHRAEYGLRVHHDSIARRHSEDAFRAVDGQLLPEGSPTITTAFNDASTVALALYAADAMTFRRLTVTPGLRFETMRSSFDDHITETESGRLVHVVLPGLGAFFDLGAGFGVLGGAYRGFSPPAPGSDAFTRPELSVNYEAGLRFSHGSASADVVGFYNDYDNLTDVCTFSSGCVDQNLDRQFDAGEARMVGLEVQAMHEPTVGPLSLPMNLAYTLTRAEFENSFESEDPIFGSVRAGDELPYVPRHQLHLLLGVETARVGGHASLDYTSSVREEAGSEPLAEALVTDELLSLDAGAFYQVEDWLKLYLNVKNLLDEQVIVARRPYGARPNAPRWAQAGVKLTF